MASDLLAKDNIKEHPMDRFTQEMLNRSSFKPEEFEHIIPISVIINKRQLALLGHILRREENDPERKPACGKDFIRTQAKHRRPYGPREHCWDANMKLAFETISAEQSSYCFTTDWREMTNIIGSEYQTNNIQQHLAIAAWATDKPSIWSRKEDTSPKGKKKGKSGKRNLLHW